MSMSIEDAYADLREADEKFSRALVTEGLSRDGQVRTAYHGLYRAASKADRFFLTCRRGGAVDEGGLLSWAKTEYDEFVRVLYRTYYLQGAYPRFNLEEDFRGWLERVRHYVGRLDDAYRLERGARPARGRRTDVDERLDREKTLKRAGWRNRT